MIHKICLPTLALFDLSLTYFAFFTYSPVTNRSAGTKALFGLNVLKVKTFLLILKTYQTKDINRIEVKTLYHCLLRGYITFTYLPT